MSQSHKIAFIYLLWLFLVWSIYVAFIYQQLSSYTVYGKLIGELVRVTIFVVPLYVIFQKIKSPKPSDLGIHNNVLKSIIIGVVLGIIFIVIAVPLTMLAKGKEFITDEISSVPIWAALSVAVIVEEIIFRGYLINAFLGYGKSLAVLISSILFVLIHYPGWYMLEMQPTLLNWVTASGSVFILGIILGLLFLKFRSLWICIIIHSANNLVAAIVK